MPLNCPSDDPASNDFSLISNWLARQPPERKTFQISKAAKYLGFFLGPGAGARQWTLAVKKWKDRSLDIAFSHMGSLLAALIYNSRAIPVLGYIAQLVPPPPDHSNNIKKTKNATEHIQANMEQGDHKGHPEQKSFQKKNNQERF